MSVQRPDGLKRYDESLPTIDSSVVKLTDTDTDTEDDDARLGLGDVLFERDVVTDVLAGIPDGHSIDQTLGLGLDGASIDTSPNHFGIGEHDLLAGRSIDSPMAMAREGLLGGTGATSTGAPPDVPTGSANPGRNMDLVAGKDGGTDDKGVIDTVVDTVVDTVNGWFGGKSGPEPPDAGTTRPPGDTPVPKPKAKQVVPGSQDDYMTNPDADTGGTGGTVTEADIKRAIDKQGGDDTRVVEGFNPGPMIEGDALATRPIDLVRDPAEDDQGSGAVTVRGGDPGPLPQDEISRPVNPGDGLPTALEPKPGPGGEPGNGGDDIWLGSESSAATAVGADASAGVINIGAQSTGGIQTVEGADGVSVPGIAGTPPTDVLGLESESFAMMGGDDDDLDELEVQRFDRADAGPGTQTEDEVYIGATSAPVEPSGAGSNGGAAGGNPAAEPSVAAPMPIATVAGVIVPPVELAPLEAAPELDALAASIDATVDLETSFDSAFDSALAPMHAEGVEAPTELPAAEDGF